MQVVTIRAPDGRTAELRVPEGATQEQVQAKIEEIKADMMGEAPGLEGKSALQRGIIGVGQGMVNVGRQLGNITGLISDEEMEAYRELDRPLLETTPGKVGSFVGEVAALAPAAGGLVGLGARGLGAMAPRLATTAASRPIATGMATGAAEGTLEGAVIGGPERRGEGAALGAVAGGLSGGVLPLVARGFIRPTPEAQRLMDLGVDLTPGQMQPKGVANLVEQASQSVAPFVGAARDSAQEEFTQRMIQQTRPVTAPEVEPGTAAKMLEDVYEQFKPEYARFDKVPVNPQITNQLTMAFRRAVDDPNSLAGDEQRKAVERFLGNQLTRLNLKRPKAGDVMSIRSAIRKKVSDAKQAGKWDEAQLLEGAEAALTDLLNEGMPRVAADQNRLLDMQYAKYKVAEDAQYRAGDRDFPTPFQWSQSVKKGVPRGQYARGAGRLRPEVQAGRKVFETVSPPTGARLATLGAAGGAGYGAYAAFDPALLTAMAVAGLPLFGTRVGRRAATGMTPLQTGLANMARMAPLGLGAVPRGAAAIGYAREQ